MNAVAQVLLERKNQSVPIADGNKIALVTNGGLMASTAGAGALLALEELGLTNAFDAVYSASAGFINVCYFLSGQVAQHVDIYYTSMVERNFIHPRRFWRPADLEVPRLLVRVDRPVDVEKLYASKTKLFSRLYDIDARRAEYLPLSAVAPEDYYKLFDATIAMKYFGEGPVEFNGHRYLDGQFTGFFQPDTKNYFNDILATDATHILFICSRRVQWESLRLPDSDRVLNIYPDKEWDLFNFEDGPARLKAATEAMHQKTLKAFSKA